MTKIEHSSIGANARRIEVQQEDDARAVQARSLTHKLRLWHARYVRTPLRPYELDQLCVWFLCFTFLASVFVYCTVSAFVLAVT
jgi:hypothetical protein